MSLSECCDFQRGVTYSKKDEVDFDGIGILRANNISLERNKLNLEHIRHIRADSKVSESQRLRKNDIFICTASGSLDHIGKVAFVDTDTAYYAGGFMGILRARKSRIEPILLFHVLLSQRFADCIQQQRAGTNIQNLKFSEIQDFEVPLPPLDEQQRLVDLFQSVEQSILHAEGQEKNLKLLQKSLSNGLVNNPPVFGNLLSEKNCTSYSFGDISDCIEQHEKTPMENGLTRFIGLENIEPENFALQGFGNIEDGTTFTKRFSKGDVLFGKRRAYLKKVAVADFDGICSSDILVFRAKVKTMLPELLTYYASSDAFMNHAVSTSAGSLSPRTKWRDLAGFELFIPDLKIQEKIVDVFNQLSESLTLIKTQTQTLKTLKQKLLNEVLG